MEANAILDAYFLSVRKQFLESQKANRKPIVRRLSLCGRAIEVVFSGQPLPNYILPALEHLATTAAANPDLVVWVWDDVTTETVMPPPPWYGHALQDKNGRVEGVYTSRGDILGFNQCRIKTAYNWSAGALSLYDPDQKIAFYWTRDFRSLPAYETSAPLRTILNWWAEGFHAHFAHGAVIGSSGGGVLLAGKGGSGKSTAALTALQRGLLYISDDYCLVTTDPSPAAYCIFSSAKVDPGNVCRADSINAAGNTAGNPDDEKTVFFLYPQFAGQIAAEIPLRAIVLPGITGKSGSALRPASRMDAIKALTVSMMCQFPGAGKKAADIMIGLVDLLPCYTLDFGTDLDQAMDLIIQLLDKTENL